MYSTEIQPRPYIRHNAQRPQHYVSVFLDSFFFAEKKRKKGGDDGQLQTNKF